MNKALGKLIVGFRRFRDKSFHQENLSYQKLVSQGQTPKTLLIGCSDSRVDPAILTEASSGEIFVIRNVANLVPPCEPSGEGFHGTSSALEFAVVNLKVENIIVLGHRQCGGIRALMAEPDANSKGFIGQWMSIVGQARQKVLADHAQSDDETKCRFAEMESIKISVKNLYTFPFIQEAVQSRHMNVIGVYFDIERGELWEFNQSNQEYRLIN